jgi:hypothetical protein
MVSGGLSSFAQGFGGQAFAPVSGDDGHDRSFITREYDSSGLKENGTIPFYRRFFDRITELTTTSPRQLGPASRWLERKPRDSLRNRGV